MTAMVAVAEDGAGYAYMALPTAAELHDKVWRCLLHCWGPE